MSVPEQDGRHHALLPICLVAGRAPCLLVGGGTIALRKARWLLANGADIEAMALHFSPDFAVLGDHHPGRMTLTTHGYQPGMDLRRFLLVIAATDDAAINQSIADDAAVARVPVNVVDDPARCTFIVPATVVRGDLRIAIATGGAAPALARNLREEISQLIPAWYGDYVEALAEMRERLLAEPMEQQERARLLGLLATPELRARLANLDREGMGSLLAERLSHTNSPPSGYEP